MIEKIKNKIKHNWNNLKWRIMKFFHISHLKLLWIPMPLRYTLSIVFIGSGIVLLTTPIPWILFIFMGIWIISPKIQYRYIWKHFKPNSIRSLENEISVNIECVLQTNPKRYQGYKRKIKKIWKYCKNLLNKKDH